MYIDAPNEPVLLQGMMSQARLPRRATTAQRPASNEPIFDLPIGPGCPPRGKPERPD